MCVCVCVCGTVWHTGTMKGSELELQDEDAFTQPEDGWKRVNTLGHYNVQDNSTIHLVPNTDRHSAAEEEPHLVVSANGKDPFIIHPYLTLPSGWAGYYTCPALRSYQFGPMRSPDVTKGHSDRL